MYLLAQVASDTDPVYLFWSESLKQFLGFGFALVLAATIERNSARKKAKRQETNRINILIIEMSTLRTLDKDLQSLGQLNRDPSQDGEWSKRSVFRLRDTIRDARHALLPNSPMSEPLANMTTFCNDWLEQYEWPNSDFKKLLLELSDNINREIEVIWSLNKAVHRIKPGSRSISAKTRQKAISKQPNSN